MIRVLLDRYNRRNPAPIGQAHCDGPCGVYDPASARIAAEAVLSMTRKLLALEVPDPSDKQAYVKYHNSFSRYVKIKEEQAHLAKQELLVLWTDYFEPHHLDACPDLHNIFWMAAKECSHAKIEVSLHHAEALLGHVEAIHSVFWATKNRSIAYYTVS